MSAIEVFTGGEQWQNHAAKMSVFYVDQDTGTETPLNTYVAGLPEQNRLHSILNKQAIVARPGMRSELGVWCRVNYNLAARTILKVYAHRHVAQGAPTEKASFYIRLRDEAAHRQMSMRLCVNIVGSLSEVHINGRFDLLTADEYERATGHQIAPHFRHLFNTLAVQRLFIEQMISEEQEPALGVFRVRVRNDRGQEVTTLRTRRRRVLEL